MTGNRFFDFRNRLLTSAKFRAWAEKIPLFQSVARRHANALFRIASGFIHSQVLLACVRLGVFEQLRDGALDADTIAESAGVPGERVIHLLRAAAAIDLLEQRPDGRFGLGQLGAAMIDNESLTALVEHHALLYEDLGDPVSIYAKDGGAPRLSELWPYATSTAPDGLNEGAVSNYTKLMSASQTMIAEQVLAAYSMQGHRRLLDIGGGAGVFAAAVARRWPHLELTVADLPAVAAIAAERIADEGLSDRIDVVGVDATRDAMPDGFDLVSFVRILHDHDEDRVLELLSAARGALHDDGILLVAEPMAADSGAGALIDAYFNVYLLAMGSGRPRTLDEIKGLLRKSGFRQFRRHRTRVPLITSVLSARR